MGQDTAAITTIDGGGADVNALLMGGSQSSFIFGGLGNDTIIAGSATSASEPDPSTLAIAGVSFWASSAQAAVGGGSETVTGEPIVSVPATTDPADFQVEVSLEQLDGSYAAPFGLLGSAWDTGTDTSPWKDASGAPLPLPGSLIVGGSGEDILIGKSNAAVDTRNAAIEVNDEVSKSNTGEWPAAARVAAHCNERRMKGCIGTLDHRTARVSVRRARRVAGSRDGTRRYGGAMRHRCTA